MLNTGAADSPPGMMQGEESAKLPGLKSVVLTPIVYEKLGNIFAFFESQFPNRKKKWKRYLTELDWVTQTQSFYMAPDTARHPIL